MRTGCAWSGSAVAVAPSTSRDRAPRFESSRPASRRRGSEIHRPGTIPWTRRSRRRCYAGQLAVLTAARACRRHRNQRASQLAGPTRLRWAVPRGVPRPADPGRCDRFGRPARHGAGNVAMMREGWKRSSTPRVRVIDPHARRKLSDRAAPAQFTERPDRSAHLEQGSTTGRVQPSRRRDASGRRRRRATAIGGQFTGQDAGSSSSKRRRCGGRSRRICSPCRRPVREK